MHHTWRSTARSIIVKALQDNKGKDEKEIRKALYDAYPFGQRKYHPYKIWLDEIKVQRGRRRFGAKHLLPVPKEQITLF